MYEEKIYNNHNTLADEMEGCLRHLVAQTKESLQRIDHILKILPDEPLYDMMSQVLDPIYQHLRHLDNRMDKMISVIRKRANDEPKT